MSSPIVIRSASTVRETDRMLQAARQAAQPVARTQDRTDYEKYQKHFRELCMEFRELFPDQFPTFRGSFEEVTALIVDYRELLEETPKAMQILMMLSYIDTALTYEADALAIESPEPWWTIWEDELGEYTSDRARTYASISSQS